jgi:hypothetical protein
MFVSVGTWKAVTELHQKTNGEPTLLEVYYGDGCKGDGTTPKDEWEVVRAVWYWKMDYFWWA